MSAPLGSSGSSADENIDLDKPIPASMLPPSIAGPEPADNASSSTATQSAPPLSSAMDAPGINSNGAIDLEPFLRMVVAQRVSDIHLRIGSPPVFRKDGDMVTTKMPPLTEKVLVEFAKNIIPKPLLAKIKNRTDFDFGYDLGDIARFRVNLFYERGKLAMVLRVVPKKIPDINDLGLPDVLNRFTDLHKGLVLVTGPTGSGKSTTLAALLNQINKHQQRHIVTLEDPIEFVHENNQSVITQRELGSDTDTFPNGIKYSLRQDPDVILIGEMRDRETISSALHAAETGHLVFSTLHTVDAVQTINRIINIYEPHERDPVRKQLAAILQGTVSQRLVKKSDGTGEKGRLAVAEIMTVSPAIRDYIFRDEIGEIYNLLGLGEYEGMCSLNNALYRAYKNQLITEEDAIGTSDNPTELQQMIRGAFHGTAG